jgi:head-tail adaptor
MTTGELTRKVALQTAQRLPDGGGGFETTWQDVTELYARIDRAETEEIPERGGRVTRRRCRLTVLHRADIAPGQRLLEGLTAYNILSLRDIDGRRVYLEIIAEVEGG